MDIGYFSLSFFDLVGSYVVRFPSNLLEPNAGPELLLEAGARHKRTLEAVSSRPWFGPG